MLAAINGGNRKTWHILLPAFPFRNYIRTCIHNRGMPDGRGFFLANKEIFRGNPDGLQGKATPYGKKRTVQAAFTGCEYRFL